MKGVVEFTLAVLLWFWKGFVLMKLWGWFLVPFGLPGIGITHAMGLLVLESLFKVSIKHFNEHALQSEYFVQLSAAYGVVLLAGWLIQLVM